MKNNKTVTNRHESVTDRNQLKPLQFIKKLRKELDRSLTSIDIKLKERLREGEGFEVLEGQHISVFEILIKIDKFLENYHEQQ